VRRALVTGGATEEPLDAMRCITNRATGELARLVTEELLAGGWSVVHLCGPRSVVPTARPGLDIVRVGTFADLERELLGRLAATAFDAVVHSFAVADFSVAAVGTVDELARRLDERLAERAGGRPAVTAALLAEVLAGLPPDRSAKLPSDAPPVVVMRANPKLLDRIRQVSRNGDVVLVSFKLLAAVDDDELMRRARAQLVRSRSDWVFVNDVGRFPSWQEQQGLLLDGQGGVTEVRGKAAVARAVATVCAGGRNRVPRSPMLGQ